MALRRAIGAVKDQTSISLARVNNTTDSMSELEIAIVKATRHEEYPPEERHLREILSLTHYSRHLVNACVGTIARRLSRTRNWVVALKCLILVQRLLAEGEAAYEQEVFFTTRRGTRLLNLSDFRDTTGRSHSWDFSAFVRTFSLYLDERLEYRMRGRTKSNVAVTYAYAYEKHYYGEVMSEEGDGGGFGEKTTPEARLERLVTKVQQLQQLVERFLATRPAGAAKNNRVVLMALYPAVKESFQTYYEITDILSHLIDGFEDLDVIGAVRLHDIFWSSAKQFDELDVYYTWTKEVGVARSSEYPEIERISSEKLELMNTYIRKKSANPQFSSLPIESDHCKQEEEEQAEGEEDPNSIKALPAPEMLEDEKKEETTVEEKQEEPEQLLQLQYEGDLLDLWDEPITSEQHGDQLSFVLFDGMTDTGPNQPSGSVWEAFKDMDSDWETELVQSTSYLPQQKTQLGRGLDMLVLDGLYRQGSANKAYAPGIAGGTGSASSVAFRSAGNPQAPMLALPPPPGWKSSTSEGDRMSSGATSAVQFDPFGPSMAVPPPPYVQMLELERKQRMMMEEQMMWQQYARGGMQGQMGTPQAQYTQGYNPQLQSYKQYPNGYGYL